MATFSSGAGGYTLILNANEVGGSASVESNTSKVSWSLQLRSNSAYCQWNPGPGDFEVRINGALVWSAQNPSLWYGGIGGTLTIASGTTSVGHNSDGSKTVYCEGKYIANSTANYLPSSSTCGGNLGLTTIPRASSFSSFSGNTIGGYQTININRKSSSFTHTLWYRIGNNGSWVGIGSNCGTSAGWTIPLSLNNKIPNGTSLTLTYILRTYNGSTQIGSDVYYNYTVYYSGAKPTAGSTSISYSNLFNNKFIANYSSAVINYSGYSGVYGSSVKSAQVIFNRSWKGSNSYNTGKLTAGTYVYQGVVTDSRNNSSYSSQQSFICYQVNNPTISINAYRSDEEGNANPSGTYITIIPTYSAHDPVGGNSIASNSFTCTSLMTTGESISNGAKKILSGASVDSEYVISGTVTDKLGRSSATSLKVGTAFVLLDVRPDEAGMAFGKYSTGPDKFEVAWPAYFDKDVYVTKEKSATYGSFSVPCSGAIEGVENLYVVEDMRSFIGTSYSNSSKSWYSVISVRHRNGAGDGSNYGMVLYTSLTNMSSLMMRKQYNGQWQQDIELIDSRNLLSKVFPVGAVYITTTNTNPSKFIGGTWVQFGQGRTLIGAGTGNDGSTSMSFTAGSTGGEYKHKLTVSELASHNHSTTYEYATGLVATNGGGAGWTHFTASTGSKSVNSTGGNGSHNNVQPYIVVYFWKRTS